ncbi:CD276 antigen [Dissostichus eleginoides]|uniref:CD276 antigen n=1 Tax=Dissostichus eleginoides TaxID=100907 RepID=A0AAD9F6X1_DISEL|nr:CD276 antigen [Dissostichus eleginoides]
MWRTPLEQTATAALFLGIIMSQIVGEGSAVKVLSQPGQQVTLLCSYNYEDNTHIPQLSVQWRGPNNQLLCHYIKHKAYQNCTRGYTISYSPSSITLTIQHVHMEDFGAHVCSVSKPHEFSDYSMELARMSEYVTSAPKSGGDQSGSTWTLIIFHTLLSVCM